MAKVWLTTGVVFEVVPSPKSHNTELMVNADVEVLVSVVAPLQTLLLVKLIFITELIVSA